MTLVPKESYVKSKVHNIVLPVKFDFGTQNPSGSIQGIHLTQEFWFWPHKFSKDHSLSPRILAEGPCCLKLSHISAEK